MTHNPKALFDAISEFIDESHDIMQRGAFADLTGLDAKVRLLCDAVLELTGDERLLYADKLEEMFRKLEALGDEAKKQRDAIAEEMQAVGQHKRATVAYTKTEASDGRPVNRLPEDSED